MKQDLKKICSIMIFVVVLVSFFFACKDTLENSRESDQHKLTAQLMAIRNMAQQDTCLDASEWRFTPIGSKSCGGPAGYISYSVKIDTAAFLHQVKAYTDQQQNFNKTWNVSSDCSLSPVPKSITCVKGKPEFVY